MRVFRNIIWFILILTILLTACSHGQHNPSPWRSLVFDLPEVVYLCPEENPFKHSRVGVFRFQEPDYAPGTGQAAAEALFGDLLKKGVFTYVSNEATHAYNGIEKSIELARLSDYDLIITGKVLHYMDGSDYMSSRVDVQISVIHVPTETVLWLATAKNADAPSLSKDFYLFQSNGTPAEPTRALLQQNSEKFSNMLLKQPAQKGGNPRDFLLCSHESKIEGMEKNFDELQMQNVLLEQQLLNERNTQIALKEEIDDLAVQADQLEAQLKEEIKRGDIKLKRYKKKTIINIDNNICFDSGSAVLKPNARNSLSKISNILNKFKNNIQIEGHTDNVPIRSGRYRSNWELSSARALAVLQHLLQQDEIAPEKLSAAGYGQYHPIAPNDSAENKSLNRRVDIVIMPSET